MNRFRYPLTSGADNTGMSAAESRKGFFKSTDPPDDAHPGGLEGPRRWLAPVMACLIVWLLMRAVFFTGIAGSDDMYYMRYAALWDRAPIIHWEARLLGNVLTAASMKVFGRSELAAVLPSLAASLLILGCVLYWCLRYGTLRQACWGGMLVAVLPLDVDMATTVSPSTIMAALMVLGTMMFLRAPDSAPVRYVAATFLSLGVVAHFASVYYVASLAVAALFVDRRRYLAPVVTTLFVGLLVFAVDVGVFYLAFDDPFLRFRLCLGETHYVKPIMPRTPDGVFNPEYVLWPIRNLLFSKALGVALVVVLVAGLWSYRRLERTGRILVVAMAFYWLWMSFGSEVPWTYVPFDRISRFLHPLAFALALLFAPVVITHRRWWLSPATGVAVLAVCALNLLGSGSWGQNVHTSRELLAYAERHPEKRFITDYHTLNEMYIVGRLKTLPNVVTTDDPHASRLLDREAVQIAAGDLVKDDEILVNPLNVARTPHFQKFLRAHSGELLHETTTTYRMISALFPPLRDHAWSIRKPPALVLACTHFDRLQTAWKAIPYTDIE